MINTNDEVRICINILVFSLVLALCHRTHILVLSRGQFHVWESALSVGNTLAVSTLFATEHIGNTPHAACPMSCTRVSAAISVCHLSNHANVSCAAYVAKITDRNDWLPPIVAEELYWTCANPKPTDKSGFAYLADRLAVDWHRQLSIWQSATSVHPAVN